MEGKNLGIASLVCGIISVIISFTGSFLGLGVFVGLILGVVAIILAINAKKKDYTEGMQKAGLVLGIIGTVLCGISFVACALCAGVLAAAGASGLY